MHNVMRFEAERQESFLKRLDDVVTAKNAKAVCEGDTYRVTRILVLGHCIAAVEDNYNGGECDIYFATAMWAPTVPEVWSDYPYPPSLEAVGLGRIEGIGSSDRLKKVEDADRWVRMILTPHIPTLDLLEPGKHEVREFQLC